MTKTADEYYYMLDLFTKKYMTFDEIYKSEKKITYKLIQDNYKPIIRNFDLVNYTNNFLITPNLYINFSRYYEKKYKLYNKNNNIKVSTNKIFINSKKIENIFNLQKSDYLKTVLKNSIISIFEFDNYKNIYTDIIKISIQDLDTFAIKFDINLEIDQSLSYLLYYISTFYFETRFLSDIFGIHGDYYIVFSCRNQIKLDKLLNHNIIFTEKIPENFMKIIKKCNDRIDIIQDYNILYKFCNKKVDINNKKIMERLFLTIYNESMYYAINYCGFVIDPHTLAYTKKKPNIDWFKSAWYPLSQYNINPNCINTIESAFYSTTFWDDAKATTNIIIKHLTEYNLASSDITITDATSNIGGNSLNFSFNFKKVNSVEIDTNVYNVLTHNIGLFNRDNIDFYNNDYLDIYHKLTQDIIFFDPPWTGSSYKYEKNMHLKLGYMNFHELILDIIINQHNKILAIKLPYNYDITTLNYNKLFRKIVIYKLAKYIIVIICL
jgi:hypothetical protein